MDLKTYRLILSDLQKDFSKYKIRENNHKEKDVLTCFPQNTLNRKGK